MQNVEIKILDINNSETADKIFELNLRAIN